MTLQQALAFGVQTTAMVRALKAGSLDIPRSALGTIYPFVIFRTHLSLPVAYSLTTFETVVLCMVCGGVIIVTHDSGLHNGD